MIDTTNYTGVFMESEIKADSQIEAKFRQVACGYWVNAEVEKPKPKKDVLFLAIDEDGQLQEGYGNYINKNRWVDKSTIVDDDWWESFTVKYWLKLDNKPPG